jgi:carbonic anhydrase
VLALAKGNTLYATASTSNWAVLNAHTIYNNLMNAFTDPNTAPAPEARKTFYLISRHDFQPCYYAPLAATPPQCVRDNDWRGWSGDETFFSEEMMTRTGVATRGPRDTSYREFEQVVHEFGHTLSEKYFGARDQQTDWAKAWGQQVKEWYPWQVQYWFNSAQSQGAKQDRATLPADVAEYIATMFSATNTWLPPRKLRDLETPPRYTFYTPGTFITAGEKYKIISDEGAAYQMQLQDDGNLVISNAAGTFQWGTFNNLKVPMQGVKGIYFKNGNLYFTTTDQQSTADEWINAGNPGVLETIHLYNEDTTITARLQINPHPEGNDFLQVINVTPGLGKTAPALLWSSHAHWSYEGEEGPSTWGELDTAYAACVDGTSQSPIDLTGAAAEDLANIAFYYQPTKLHLENNGHTIQVNYATGSYIVVDEIRYDLKQFHFHSPSENAIDGKSFPLEMHLVHRNAANQLAVVAVFLDEGADNTVLQAVWDHLSTQIGSQAVDVLVNATELLPVTQTAYRFSGSLTTPPCTEGVSWLVMTSPITVSSEQIEAFQNLYEGNNRPLQPLNGRDLSLDSTP